MTKPITHAIYKATPNDFVVTEIMPLADNLSHEGEHLWLLIEKIGINTAFVAKLLANVAKIPIHDVGYSGLKDRHAKTLFLKQKRKRFCCITTPIIPSNISLPPIKKLTYEQA